MSMRTYMCKICHVFYMGVNAFLKHKRSHLEKSTRDVVTNENVLPNTIGIEETERSNIKMNGIKPVEKLEGLEIVNSWNECREELVRSIETKTIPTNTDFVLVEIPQQQPSDSLNKICSTKTNEVKKPVSRDRVRPIKKRNYFRSVNRDTNSTKAEKPMSYSLRSRSLPAVVLTQSKSKLDTQQNSKPLGKRKRKSSSNKTCNNNLKNLSEPKLVNLDVKRKRIKLELSGLVGHGHGRPGGKKVTKCAFCKIDLVEPIDYHLLRTGTVEIPISCRYCKNTYTDLNILIRNYFREKRFACSSCENIFIRKSRLISKFHVYTRNVSSSNKNIKPKLKQQNNSKSKLLEKVTKKFYSNNKLQKKKLVKPKLQVKTHTNYLRKLQSNNPLNPNLKKNSSTLELLKSTDKKMNVFLTRDTRTNWSLRHLGPSVREIMLLQQKPGKKISERIIDLEFDKQTNKILAESVPSPSKKIFNR